MMRLGQRLGRATLMLAGLQLIGGVINLLLLAPVWMQLVHLLVADLLWIIFVMLGARVLAGEPAPRHRPYHHTVTMPRRVFAPLVLLSLALPALALGQAAAPAAPPQPTLAATADVTQKADAYLRAQARVNGFSGTVLLARGGSPILSNGYGWANAEWEVPNTPTTKFRLGSITKQFTATLVLRLQEQKKLTVQDPICTYLAPCPDAWKPVTIHHLLTHTSGIPSYTGLPDYQKTMMVPRTIEQMVAVFRDLPLEFAPGEKFKYNNSGYFLLGVIIEKVAGKKYEDALRDEIFAPLGMKDTGYDWSEPLLPRRASGYTRRGDTWVNAKFLDMQQPYSAGSLYSTVEDLLKWDQALYSDRVLPAAARGGDVHAVQGQLRVRLGHPASRACDLRTRCRSATAAASTASRR